MEDPPASSPRRVMLNELGGLALLVAGLGSLGLAAALAACCLPIRSPLELLLATYVLAWAWLVAVSLLLSSPELLTRAGLLVGIGVAFGGAAAVWVARGRPRPPSLAPALQEGGVALRQQPALLVLAVTAGLGSLYIVALAFLTPASEGDALAYHVARAAFWHQEHGVGYIANVTDARLNGNPPNAEIGQLATMLLSGGDRYVALPQLAALGALVLSVAGLAHRIGLAPPEALFGALAFATLPVVAVQAAGALNDLVVASFLAVAVFFALGSGAASLGLFAVALALALGTKLTAVLALPALAIVLAVGRPRAEWPRLALAGLVGIALGSVWYVVNLVKTGELDGGLAEAFDQQQEVSASAIVADGLRLALDVVDMSGAASPHSLVFVFVAGLVALIGLLELGRSRARALQFLAASLVVASPALFDEVVELGQRFVLKSWRVLGEPATAPFDEGWGLNVDADPVDSWYGPLGALLLVSGVPVAVWLWRRRRLPTAAIGFALAPWLLLVTLALTVVWDPYRGRFLAFGVALAAATWGVALRSSAAATAVAAVGATAMALALANFQGKPSGLGDLWPSGDPPPPPVDSVWGEPRWRVQTWLRPGDDREDILFRFVDEELPDNAHVAVAPRENDFVSPYFGPRLSRRVSLLPRNEGEVPTDADWLVLSPGLSARRCRDSWRTELALESGWRVERRLAPDTCPEAETRLRSSG